jgi:hypothetical protein
MSSNTEILPVSDIGPLTRSLRETRVTTKRLNEQFRGNRDRFPDDFPFQLTREEWLLLRSHFATSNRVQGMRSQIATASKRNLRYLPYAFTEHGALMAANILNSPRGIAMIRRRSCIS